MAISRLCKRKVGASMRKMDIGTDSQALTDEAAEELFRQFKSSDPLPHVPSALLNSAHVGDYLRTVAMVWPYDLTRRKAASYAMRVGHHIAYHDPANTAADPYRSLNEGETFELPPNSLVYVKTLERFQLPDYLAARFNLHIDLVHKGLLLGTGPVVDPGFIGHLVVPLHNLTRNTYTMEAGQDLIWAEFTKTSMMPAWTGPKGVSRESAPLSDYVAFDKAKSDHEMSWYINKATKSAQPGGKDADFPANSIPERMAISQTAAEQASTDAAAAKTAAEQARGAAERLRNVGGVALVVLVIGLVAVFIATFQLVSATQSMVREEREAAADGRVAAIDLERAVMRAEILLINACEEGPQALSTERRERISAARADANSIARTGGVNVPFPEEETEGFTCPI
ncbi:hypothetical protein MKP08_04025 [Erythrobacter sp. LQ02-29]|uniref:dCTP deaminase domain-containing protein n=1 Tax=Erythrobacter sp. LQ02-29 TaxID=2920384 RepID=UPI001F4E5123|nr:hypothetical protein [Erythrobacter sp. LQ02-29]MCP9221914.1 hypothetical protein [Erythrobacter sp. LQ02-29]